jgi:hypothetical protein
MRIYPVIGESDGAKHISQYLAIVETGKSPILKYPGSTPSPFVCRDHHDTLR